MEMEATDFNLRKYLYWNAGVKNKNLSFKDLQMDTWKTER